MPPPPTSRGHPSSPRESLRAAILSISSLNICDATTSASSPMHTSPSVTQALRRCARRAPHLLLSASLRAFPRRRGKGNWSKEGGREEGEKGNDDVTACRHIILGRLATSDARNLPPCIALQLTRSRLVYSVKSARISVPKRFGAIIPPANHFFHRGASSLTTWKSATNRRITLEASSGASMIRPRTRPRVAFPSSIVTLPMRTSRLAHCRRSP